MSEFDAALEAAALEDVASSRGLHAGAETDRLGTLALVWSISGEHNGGDYRKIEDQKEP